MATNGELAPLFRPLPEPNRRQPIPSPCQSSGCPLHTALRAGSNLRIRECCDRHLHLSGSAQSPLGVGDAVHAAHLRPLYCCLEPDRLLLATTRTAQRERLLLFHRTRRPAGTSLHHPWPLVAHLYVRLPPWLWPLRRHPCPDHLGGESSSPASARWHRSKNTSTVRNLSASS